MTVRRYWTWVRELSVSTAATMSALLAALADPNNVPVIFRAPPSGTLPGPLLATLGGSLVGRSRTETVVAALVAPSPSATVYWKESLAVDQSVVEKTSTSPEFT